MYKKECVAMILAGGQGSRLGALTKKIAKPAVPFGAKYRIIDFTLSNCSNSGINTVGVLTQYQPMEQIEDECKAIRALGPFENLLLVTGENPRQRAWITSNRRSRSAVPISTTSPSR